MIEGGALAACLMGPNQQAFMDMCKACRAVVCCRVSPMQKAQVGGPAHVNTMGCMQASSSWLQFTCQTTLTL